MEISGRKINNHQKVFLREAKILRKNLDDWNRMLLQSQHRGVEQWPSMLGRLNAAMNQVGNLDRGIDDLLEHFVYQPRKCTTNPQDIPTFLSTRLVESDNTATVDVDENDDDNDCNNNNTKEINPVTVLRQYEDRAAALALEFENNLPRF